MTAPTTPLPRSPSRTPAPPRIFSRPRIVARAARALALRARADAERADWLVREMALDMVERLAFMKAEPSRALVIGDAGGTIAAHLRGSGCAVDEPDPRRFDEEAPIGGEDCAPPYDLIVSLARLDVVNDLPGALLHLRGALAEGGLLIATFPGAGSLPRLRAIMQAADGARPAPRIHPQIDARMGSALLERAAFRRQVVDSQPLHARYRSLARLVADLRAQGLASVLADPGPALTKAGLARARDAFDQAAEDGAVRETFEILTLTGWK